VRKLVISYKPLFLAEGEDFIDLEILVAVNFATRPADLKRVNPFVHP
jgi:hypothetical protein